MANIQVKISSLNLRRTTLALLAVFIGVIVYLGVNTKKALTTLQESKIQNAQDLADDLANDVMDQFFERYGDAQAFALNENFIKILGKKNSKLSSKELEIVSRTLAHYSKLYRVYPLMLLINPAGEIVATNSEGPNSEPVPANNFIGKIIKNDPCVKNPQSQGESLSGTFVSQPRYFEIFKNYLGDKTRIQSFAAPVLNSDKKVIGHICLLATQNYYAGEVAQIEEIAHSAGWRSARFFLSNKEGEFFSTVASTNSSKSSELVRFSKALSGDKFDPNLEWHAGFELPKRELFQLHEDFLAIFLRFAFLLGLVFFLGFLAYTFAQRKMLKQKLELERSLGHKILQAQENERELIAQELHDELGQNMSLLKIEFAHFSKACENLAINWDQQTHSIRKTLEDTTYKLRNLNAALSPAMLRNVGLLPAVKWLLESFEEKTKVHVKALLPSQALNFGYERNLCIYRIVQEFLTNTAKHSNASELRLSLSEISDKHFELIIEDDGRGFNASSLSQNNDGLGISGMQRRAASMGASLKLESFPKEGTRLKMSWARLELNYVETNSPS